MEVLNPQILSRIPIISPKFPITSLKNINPSTLLSLPTSKFSFHSPFPLYSPLSNPKRFQISAHFTRPTTHRRNSLRKKLTQRQQQQKVSHNPITNDPSPDFQNPDRKFLDTDSFHSNSADDSIEDSIFNVSSEDIVESASVKESKESNLYSDMVESDSVKDSKSKLFGESVLWNKLESWVDQYKKDTEFWGIGSGPIFTLFQGSDGSVQRVVINEDEILKRSGIDPLLYKQNELEDFNGVVNLKISHAKFLAKEMENGNHFIANNSSVAKFVVSGEKSGFVNAIRGVTLRPRRFSKLSKVGIAMLCSFVVVWAVKRLFNVGEDSVEYTRLEKEMTRRKIKARTEKEKLVKGSVEVIQESREKQPMSTERPRLDNQELMDSILKAKLSTDKLALLESPGTQAADSSVFDNKIQEIRAMAKHARELERRDPLPYDSDGEDGQVVNESSNEEEEIQQHGDEGVSSPNNRPNGYAGEINGLGGTIEPRTLDNHKSDDTGFFRAVDLVENSDTQTSNASIMKIPHDSEIIEPGARGRESGLNLTDMIEISQAFDAPNSQASKPKKKSDRVKPKIIRSVKEAREYLSQKHEEQESNQESKGKTVKQVDTVNVIDPSTFSGMPDISYVMSAAKDFTPKGTTKKSSDPETAEEGDGVIDLPIPRSFLDHRWSSSSKETGLSSLMLSREERDSRTSQEPDDDSRTFQPSVLVGTSDTTSTLNACGDFTSKTKADFSAKNNSSEDVEERNGAVDVQTPGTSFSDEGNGRSAEMMSSVKKVNWMEKNFHEFEPIVKKIHVGFKDNYMVARDKTKQELNPNTEMNQLKSDEDDDELEWMKDDKLREIVFQVRENELAGQDPFYMMDDEDKLVFYNGLEKKVEKENEKLSSVHKWLHSHIENLDYGADGISLYDPPEKIIPRWKGPPIDNNNPDSLNNFVEQRKALFAESFRDSNLTKKDAQVSLQLSKESLSPDIIPATSVVSDQNIKIQYKDSRTTKTVIETSDGSVRAGKKSGKEYWQHTKKRSQGFLESYNAETDPEIKAVMKDIGKDLDRWVTEKEVQEAADLMDKIPERGRKVIEEKLNKVKREMELFGPQAVVSKYQEYAEEKEEDYLWWLDLPHVLCIELYTKEAGEQKVGFYALEMASDLELDPKQYHVIAFEDAGDCKNLCYIIQAHMEMLGSGNAFVVAQLPKDAFREAKANGFSVTVIRRGELQLNVDQTLEEVEEQIIEIGSKIYHDKITRERSLDIRSLMKGVFGVSKPTKRRRAKRKLKKPTKKQ